MSHALYLIGHVAGRHPWRVIGAWLVIAVAIFTFNSTSGGAYDETFSLPGSDSQAAADAIQDRFPQQTLYASNVIFHSEDGLSGPGRAGRDRAGHRAGWSAGPHVIAVNSPYDPRGPTLSADGQTAFATVGFDVEKIGSAEASTPPRRLSKTSVTRASRWSTTAVSATRTSLQEATAR